MRQMQLWYTPDRQANCGSGWPHRRPRRCTCNGRGRKGCCGWWQRACGKLRVRPTCGDVGSGGHLVFEVIASCWCSARCINMCSESQGANRTTREPQPPSRGLTSGCAFGGACRGSSRPLFEGGTDRPHSPDGVFGV